MGTSIIWFLPMDFSNRLVKFRKLRGYTQQAIADNIALHVNQIKRYEAGTAQPTLETLVRLAKALRLSLDELVFDESESQPSAQMKRLVDSVERLSEGEQSIIRELIDGMIIKYEVKRLSEAASAISN